MSVLDLVKQNLNHIKFNDQYRTIPKISNHANKYIELNGLKVLNLSSNNYLGLAENDFLKQYSIEAIKNYGCSSGASRIVSGNYEIYAKLEEAVANFKHTQKALVLNSGYVANISLLQALAKNATIFCDKLNHASIIDGMLLSGAKFYRYAHLDMQMLENLLKKDTSNKIIITDTIFSMDGDAAPLKEIVRLSKQYEALTIVDEAHATGIFGEGRGYAYKEGLSGEIDIHMGTFSKALGSFGAYVASSEDIIDYLINTARGFIFSTSLPPAVIGANLASINYILKNPHLGEKLILMSDNVRHFLKNLGFDVGNSISQIIPVILKTNKAVLVAQKILLEKGVFVGAIRPPTVPKNTSRLRISLRADLDDNDLELIKDAFFYLGNTL
ncbi:MAG: aminotransferase class I/II-fold pyridoxal phosphate-dependent enzyme [Desulfurella sp.]|jgi:8-amino-7-oxononanoate synthase|uniref:8-amino-7-oxononanoate synthase n=1 Tax=Desulfurella multipotens TaxID=79269 RepID=A0A1G6MG75_9BACT|nr:MULTISPECIES: 8-amino-7-oxononanoate synthase [Desulfurella]PMP67802.1 MAG: 8-amino-7-oxononanoate synthase [Desulfurella multipotens]PMP88710.1 MAG: 8-amino-7-oxononanoate synthase [Desulfurella sp.]SDC54277.1 8-amino-7-oxononanoate synthase [Desulfurella multipotens]HEX13369.1 8-amino-7-oxononanoate synthase [Desulfurella acetivorans]